MAATAVLIPYRAGCPHRALALEHILALYATRHPDLQVVVGEMTTGPWCKALAVQAALERTNAQLLIVADADVWSDDLATAMTAVDTAGGWAIPHRSVHRLTAASTARWIAGEPLEQLDLDERAYLGMEGGGIVVLHREVYEACPLDARFEGWGSEDRSWGCALRTLHGSPWRPTGHAPLVHLWHPPQPRMNRRHGSLNGRGLERRYINARLDADVMRRLVEEARCSPIC